jgi:hypothetical protein
MHACMDRRETQVWHHEEWGWAQQGTHLMSERFDQVVFVVYKRKGADVMHQVESFRRDHKVYTENNNARCDYWAE